MTSRTQRTTTDRDEAEQVITDLYLPNRLDLCGSREPLRMALTGVRLGALTASRLTYGRRVRLRTAEAENFHVDLPLHGRVVSGSGSGAAVATRPGEGLVFSPGARADLSWSADCEQLCLMVPRADLEAELERLLGRSLRGRLVFDFTADLQAGPARRWLTVLDLLREELDDPTDLSDHPLVARHVEALVVDGLLLSHRHNHSDLATGGSRVGPAAAVRRAVELLEDTPAEAWTTVRLAAEVHLGVRALQAGFRRDLAVPPMTYLRRVRLRMAHEALRAAEPGTTTVQAVALALGLLHPGRFAAAYRETFGELPSETLDRGR